jgi:hypothetical protein
MTHLKGLHEAGGLRTLRIAGAPGATADRSKLAATLSRLEHQRALLARQLGVWTKKQQVTQLRLGVLDKEIARIGRLIGEIGTPHSAVKRRDRALPIKTELQADSGVATVRRGGVSIDY